MSRARSRINRSRPAIAALLVCLLATWAWGQQPVFDVAMLKTPAANCLPGVVNFAFAGPVVGSGLNRLGIVLAQSQGIAENAVDWGFTRMASLGAMGGSGALTSRFYYVSMPPSGSSTITVYTLTPASVAFWGVYAFAGVSLLNPVAAQASLTGSGTQFTENTGVGGGANTMHVDSLVWSGNPTYSEPAVVQGTQTVRLNPTLTRPCTGVNVGWTTSTGTGVPVFAWRNGGNQSWGGGNRAINGGVAAAAAGACGQLPLVGVGC
jgi:hypothetical protein